MLDGDVRLRQVQHDLAAAELAHDGSALARLHAELDSASGYSADARLTVWSLTMRPVAIRDNKRMRINRIAIGSSVILLITAMALVTASVLLPKSLISLASNGGAPASAASGKLSTMTDAKLMPMTFEYEAASTLSGEAGTGKVYELLLDGTPESVLERAAKAFGISGSVEKSSYWTKENPSFFIGSEDGTKPSVSIWWNGTANWYFSNVTTQQALECTKTAISTDGTEFCAEYPQAKATPELIPTRSRILADAKRIFSATGLTVENSDITVYRDEWSASASANQKVGGQQTAISWSIGYDSTGKLAWASGNSVIAVERGSFQTISAKDAVKRLSDWRWSGAPASSEYEQTSASVDGVPIGDESMKVTVSSAKAMMLQIWDKSGKSWLVPGYGMNATNSMQNFVVSLPDGVIELPDPMVIQPMIDDMGVTPQGK